jgi:hypothetical protein
MFENEIDGDRRWPTNCPWIWMLSRGRKLTTHKRYLSLRNKSTRIFGGLEPAKYPIIRWMWNLAPSYEDWKICKTNSG